MHVDRKLLKEDAGIQQHYKKKNTKSKTVFYEKKEVVVNGESSLGLI